MHNICYKVNVSTKVMRNDIKTKLLSVLDIKINSWFVQTLYHTFKISIVNCMRYLVMGTIDRKCVI